MTKKQWYWIGGVVIVVLIIIIGYLWLKPVTPKGEIGTATSTVAQ